MYNYLDPAIDDIEDVLAMRANAFALMREGKTIMKWTGEGDSAERQFVAPISEILAETRLFLKQADPDTYGPILRQSKTFFI